MADRGVLFSGPMIVALLENRKTQTRRIFNGTIEETKPGVWHVASRHGGVITDDEARISELAADYVPYAVGDRLWVREAWATLKSGDGIRAGNLWAGSPLIYYANAGTANLAEGVVPTWGRLRASMHMPRWASRLTLTVQRVRVQRLQEISEEDAIAEGAYPIAIGLKEDGAYRCWYHQLWDSLNAARAPWSSNPWVVAYTFNVRHGNIDA